MTRRSSLSRERSLVVEPPAAPRAPAAPPQPVAVPYAKLPLAEKQAVHRDRMREPAIACPHCETQLVVDQLPGHIATSCPGRREPHQLARWVTWTEALEHGVADATLRFWVAKGAVQTKGPQGDRRYLLRDIVRLLARRAPQPAAVTRRRRY